MNREGYLFKLRRLIGHEPLIVAGASVILMNSKHEICLVERSDNGFWGLPAGSLELFEEMEACAKREVFEETGLIVHKLNLITIYSGKDFYYVYPNGDKCANVIASYWTNDFSGDITKTTSETKNCRFFKTEKMPQNIANHEKRMIKNFFMNYKKDRSTR